MKRDDWPARATGRIGRTFRPCDGAAAARRDLLARVDRLRAIARDHPTSPKAQFERVIAVSPGYALALRRGAHCAFRVGDRRKA